MINNQCIWLKISQLIEHLLFYIPYKSCKHSLTNIDFIAPVYERFDNPSYSSLERKITGSQDDLLKTLGTVSRLNRRYPPTITPGH